MRGLRQAIFMLTLIAVPLVSAQNPPYVVLDDGRQVSGTSVKADEDGRILLNTGRGVLTFEPGTRVVTARPRELDRAIQHMQQRQFTEAAAQLRLVVQEYRHLGWDIEALKLLARAYVGAGRHDQAVDAYDRLFAVAPEARRDSEDIMRYVRSLEAGGQTDKLDALLPEMIRSGPRQAAAWAQLRRGRTAFEAGQYESALVDFKRTADFFRDEPEVLPEAIFRTALALKRLNHADAQVYYRKLRTDFASSPFAARPLE